MGKKEFIDLYFQRGEFASKGDAEKKAAAFLDVIEEILTKGEEISFVGFGKFTAIDRAPYSFHNPKTGELTETKAKKIVRFRPAERLIKKINSR